MKVTFRTHSISPGDHRSSRGSGPAVPDEVLATTGLGGSARQMSASVFHPSSGRPDCVAGHVRLELRNVVAKYPFEGWHRSLAIRPNLRTGDYSRPSCEKPGTWLDQRMVILIASMSLIRLGSVPQTSFCAFLLMLRVRRPGAEAGMALLNRDAPAAMHKRGKLWVGEGKRPTKCLPMTRLRPSACYFGARLPVCY
jgi:hypothetical protein